MRVNRVVPDRVVICGAGVIGSAVAYYLAKRGVTATIIESDDDFVLPEFYTNKGDDELDSVFSEWGS